MSAVSGEIHTLSWIDRRTSAGRGGAWSEDEEGEKLTCFPPFLAGPLDVFATSQQPVNRLGAFPTSSLATLRDDELCER